MKPQRLDVIRISRPRFWLYLAGPFVIGYISGVRDVNEFLSPLFWAFLLYFLLPANIFLYGVNDLADSDTDQFNEKKKGYELALKNDQEKMLKVVLWSCIAITLVLAYFTRSVIATVILSVFLFLSFAYSQLPFRWKARPLIDSASNILYVLPGVLGYFIVSENFPSWWAILGCGLWTAAMHLFSAIPDIKADSLAKLKTTAVLLGEKNALICCSLLWLSSAVVLAVFFKNVLLLPMFIYSLLPVICLFKITSPAQLYRVFPFLNAGLGFMLFWCVFFYRFW